MNRYVWLAGLALLSFVGSSGYAADELSADEQLISRIEHAWVFPAADYLAKQIEAGLYQPIPKPGSATTSIWIRS